MIALHAHVESLLSSQKMSDTNGKSAAGGRKVQKKATKRCKSKGNNRPEQDKPACMKTPPNDDEKEFELVEGKEYHRCPVQESWTRHKP